MNTNGIPNVAFFDFTSCEGCQLTILDALQDYPELLNVVEIVQFREAMTEKSDDYQIAFIEGSCSRKQDENRLKKIRQNAAVVVALGACAHLGGINAIKNLHKLENVRSYVYGDKAHWYDTGEVRPIEAIIPVEMVIPGCPIDREEFIACVKSVLLGVKPPVPDYPICVECKLNENNCLFNIGQFCLGPITRAGCKAICPSYGQSCEACRGFISNPNENSMLEVFEQHGVSPEQISSIRTMFTTYLVRGTPAVGEAGK